MSTKDLNIIVAVANDGAIGKRGDLLWHIKEDLLHFKKVTAGHTVLMGRKTWESLPFKPLKNRRNIVITANKDYKAEGAEIFHSIDAAIDSCDETEKVFCIGGGMLYEQMLPLCNHLYITRVYTTYDADTFIPTEHLFMHTKPDLSLFPDYDYLIVDERIWQKDTTDKKNNTQKKKDSESGWYYKFEVYVRKT
ncbi:MAG: dihydrofolate reductase [Bacteroidales bacterium]|jgi:dihydrofolate reductase|nr:dihydrofolate reductase [Bacteroidales bacterium]